MKISRRKISTKPRVISDCSFGQKRLLLRAVRTIVVPSKVIVALHAMSDAELGRRFKRALRRSLRVSQHSRRRAR
jgi:hypothetical protein